MATCEYDVFFDSGGASPIVYTEGSDISLIQITDSDQDYYQNGMITLFNPPSTQNIGDAVKIKINDIIQFDGYIARRQQGMDFGKGVETYQLIGRTYDLWRRITDSDATYSGNAGYIISSLVSSYASISSNINTDDGSWPGSYVDDIDLTNSNVGDCVVTLAKLDNYKFYIDTDGVLQYFNPTSSSDLITIQDADVLEMTPIEEADEDIANDCLIIGATDYISSSRVLGTDYSAFITGATLIAQKFTAGASRLSAVRFYLDWSSNSADVDPDTLKFEIREDADSRVLDDSCDNLSTYNSSYYNMESKNSKYLIERDTWIEQGYSVLTGTPVSDVYYAGRIETYKGDGPKDGHYRLEFLQPRIWKSRTGTLWAEFRYVDQATLKPGIEVLGSSSIDITQTDSWGYETIYFLDQDIIMSGGTEDLYCGVFYWDDKSTPVKLDTTKGRVWVVAYTSPDNSTWTLKTDVGDMNYAMMGWRASRYKRSGGITTDNFLAKTKYITISGTSAVDYSGNTFFVSGSVNQGVSWSGLVNGVKYEMGDEGNYCTGKYNFFAYSHSAIIQGNNHPKNFVYCPIIETITIRSRDSTDTAAGEPGNKIRHSNDISWTISDLPYPSGWSNWESYSDPKLELNVGQDYWMIISSNCASDGSEYWKYFYNSGESMIRYSVDGGSNWLDHTLSDAGSGSISHELGYIRGAITYHATDDDSITLYGRHPKIITDSSITSEKSAKLLAEAHMADAQDVPNKGMVTIDGDTSMSVDGKIVFDLSNIDYSRSLNIVSYTQSIDNRGFTTTIEYGKHLFDMMKKISDLEKETFG